MESHSTEKGGSRVIRAAYGITFSTSFIFDRILNDELPGRERENLLRLGDALSEVDIQATENTNGYGLSWQATGRSTYVERRIGEGEWNVVRHQVRTGEPIHSSVSAGDTLPAIAELEYDTRQRSSTLGDGSAYEIAIRPSSPLQTALIIGAIQALATPCRSHPDWGR